jgi:hypothetical protein
MPSTASPSNAERRSLSLAAGLAALLLAAAGAEADTGVDGPYTWSAKLVSVDETAATVVVTSRIVNHADVGDLSQFAEGDRVTITWSGLNWASGIRGIARGTGAGPDRFSLPAEFVSSEMDGQYVTFRVPIPSEDVSTVSALPPGDWVTLTSPHRPSNPTEAVVDIRPYNDVG